MTPILGLLFDKDGTLFDFRATWGGWTRRLVTELTQNAPDRVAALCKTMGYNFESGDFAPDSPVIAHTTAEIRDLILPHLPQAKAAQLLERMNQLAFENDMIEAVPLVPLFEGFVASGLRVGLATNDAEGPAHAHLRRANIDHCFDFVAGFDSGWGGKPDTGQMQAFLKHTGLRPESVAMVGDSLHDLDAGRAAGMRTVAVLTGIAKAEALAVHADVVLADIGGLPDWISQQGIPL